MSALELYGTKGAFYPGEAIELVVETDGVRAASELRLTVLHLAETVDVLACSIPPENGKGAVSLEWQASRVAPRGYGVKAEALEESGNVLAVAHSAFDVLPHWTAYPRYGFLTDFTPGRDDISETLLELARYHINGLQFYDWLYRHDQLLPPDTVYRDPLGRSLSLDIVEGFIKAAHDWGMAAMPYLAVYAASLPFWSSHPEWALYDLEGKPLKFEEFLGLMDPSPGSPWTRHLLGQCAEVLLALPFDGLHVDQYGDPKEARDSAGRLVNIPEAFAAFVHELKAAHSQSTVVFNAVGNWPIEQLATSSQDFVYIEIWPPDVYYRDVARIATEARSLSGDRPVVIALYLPADRPENVYLADALLYSLGATRIELGEGGRLLTDPYFPKHEPLTNELRTSLRRMADFAIRYEELIGPSAGRLANLRVRAPAGVRAHVRSCPGWLTLCLVNMTGLGEPRWDEVVPKPQPLTSLPIQIALATPVRRAWWASPDHDNPGLSPLPVETDGAALNLTIPELGRWAIIALELVGNVFP
jgi:dextranase